MVNICGHVETVSYPNHTLPGPPKQLTSTLCTYMYFCQYLTTALESVEGETKSMWPSNPGPLALESDELLTAVHGPA